MKGFRVGIVEKMLTGSASCADGTAIGEGAFRMVGGGCRSGSIIRRRNGGQQGHGPEIRKDYRDVIQNSRFVAGGKLTMAFTPFSAPSRGSHDVTV